MMVVRSQAAKDHVSYKVSDRNKTRAYLECSGDDCPAYARISFHTKTEQFRISQVQDQHSCQGSLEKLRGSQREQIFLVKHLREGMTVNSKAPIKDVQHLVSTFRILPLTKQRKQCVLRQSMRDGSSTIWWKAMFNGYFVRIPKIL